MPLVLITTWSKPVLMHREFQWLLKRHKRPGDQWQCWWATNTTASIGRDMLSGSGGGYVPNGRYARNLSAVSRGCDRCAWERRSALALSQHEAQSGRPTGRP